VRILTLEHDKLGYNADFVVYTAVVLLLSGSIAVAAPVARYPSLAAIALTGLVAWTALEYLFHRFVLHRIPPFSDWHGQHHQRPDALIGTSAFVSAALIAALVFLPAYAFADAWTAVGLTLGVATGYLAYVLTHHAAHHWHFTNRAFKRSRHWHARHHARSGKPCRYGVTTEFWDRLLGTA
jgi:cyclopropane-fatty-acyl-phospholipid synthase